MGNILKVRVKQDPASIITGQTVVVGAQNLSSEGLFAQNNNGVLEFKGLQAGTNISLTPSSTGILITAVVTGVTGQVTEATFTGYTATTETRLQGIESNIVVLTGLTIQNQNDINYISGITGTKLNTTVFNGYTASTASVLTGLDNDINYLSGQTANKLNTSVFNSYTGSSAPILNSAITGVTAGANLAVSQTGRVVNITFTGSTGSGDVTHTQLDPWTGATETRLDDIEADIVYLSGQTASKLNTSLFNTYTGNTATALSNINSELDLALTGVTAGANLAVNNSNPRKPHITFTGSTGGGAYLPLSGGTVTGLANFSVGASAYGDIVSITGTTLLSSIHVGKTIEANGTFTITFPNSLVTGAKINVINVGSGTITLAATTTLQSKSSNTKLASQYGGASVYHRGSNVWLAVGDLTA